MIRNLLEKITPFTILRRARYALSNWRRRRHKALDYVLITLSGTIPALPETRGWLQSRVFGEAPLSLWELDENFQQIADDPRPKGVVLFLRDLTLSLADLQTLRGSIQRLRARGKRVVCYAQMYDTALYYLASAADEIILQPGGELMTTGLRSEMVFLKDTLASVGAAMDVVAISPYKGALDQLARSEFSPEGQQQMEWLLDSRFSQIVSGIAEGRGISPDAARAIIDTAPHLDRDALQAGYVDAVLYEEQLAEHLGAAHLVLWHDAKRRLLRRYRRESGGQVAVLRVAGLMVPGESGSPPGNIPLPLPIIGEPRAGDLTVVQQVRALIKDEDVAAVVLFIDSGGGAVIAAEAMTSALEALAKTRPLVVCMNAVAASGGYEIATPGAWIVAQPGTITGSIGVVTAKLVTGGLREKLQAHTVTLSRGENAGIFSDTSPFDESQRAVIRASVEHFYADFIRKVAQARRMTVEAVDAIGGGRVWTGEQALAHGLVDELGDIRVALRKARELASLPETAPITFFEDKGKPLPPQLAEAAQPAAYLSYCLENARHVASGTAQALMLVRWADRP